MVSTTLGVESLTFVQMIETHSYKSVYYNNNTCINRSVGDICSGNRNSFQSAYRQNPSFTFTLASNVPPASFVIHYRRCILNNFPPTLETLTGGSFYYSIALSELSNNYLYVINTSSTAQPSYGPKAKPSPSLSNNPSPVPSMQPSDSCPRSLLTVLPRILLPVHP